MIRGFAAFALGGLAAVFATGCEPAVPEHVREGEPTPPLAGRTVDGDWVDLRDYLGRVVLVDFWGVRCPPCVASLPRYRDLVRSYEGRPFAMLGVNVDSRTEELRDFLDRGDYPWPNILDVEKGRNVKAWDIDVLPTIILVDADGTIAFRSRGTPDDEALRTAIDGLLAR